MLTRYHFFVASFERPAIKKTLKRYGETLSDINPYLKTICASVLWHCWLGYVACRNCSQFYLLVLGGTLNPTHSLFLLSVDILLWKRWCILGYIVKIVGTASDCKAECITVLPQTLCCDLRGPAFKGWRGDGRYRSRLYPCVNCKYTAEQKCGEIVFGVVIRRAMIR